MKHYEELRSQIVAVLACEPITLQEEKVELKKGIEKVLNTIVFFLRQVEQDSGNELLQRGLPKCILEFVDDVMVLKPDLEFDDKNIVNELASAKSKIGSGASSRSGRLKPILEDLQQRTKYTLWSWSI
jgi:hypothetical protein